MQNERFVSDAEREKWRGQLAFELTPAQFRERLDRSDATIAALLSAIETRATDSALLDLAAQVRAGK